MKVWTETTPLKRNPLALSSKIHEEIVLFDDQQGSYFALDLVGSKIWELLQEPRTLNDIVTELCSVFEVSEEVCRKDVTGFLNQMMEKNLVEPMNSWNVPKVKELEVAKTAGGIMNIDESNNGILLS